MDSVSATLPAQAAAPATPITADNYATLGRQQGAFWASQAQAAQVNGTNNVSFGFKDALDLINPLQHLPIISSIYHAVTGDESNNPAVKVVGDAIYGGPLGAVSGAMDGIFKEVSGKDTLATLAGIFDGDASDNNPAAAPTAVAANTAPVPGSPSNATTTVAAAAPAANDDVALADIKWNSPANSPIMNLAAGVNTTPTGGNQPMQVAAAAKPSMFFQNLQKSVSPQASMPSAPANNFFNPTTKQFTGVQPAAFHPADSKTAANPVAGLAPNSPPGAADISNAAIANANAAAPVDTIQNPQSDFAKKMMDALDRYKAAQQAGDISDTTAPAVDTGM